MLLNLINPSDPYTLEADDFEIAAVAVCLLGAGKYPATALGNDAREDNNVPHSCSAGMTTGSINGSARPSRQPPSAS